MSKIKKKLAQILSSTKNKDFNKSYTNKRPQEAVRCIWNLRSEA